MEITSSNKRRIQTRRARNVSNKRGQVKHENGNNKIENKSREIIKSKKTKKNK